MSASNLRRPALLGACLASAALVASACGSSGDKGSTSTASRQAAASSEVVSCPNKTSSRRYLGWVNTTGIPLKITAATANCVAFSQTGNPTSINGREVRPETTQRAQAGTWSASQRLEMVACSSQKPATTCVWDASRNAYTDDCTPWDITIARELDGNPGRVLGTVGVHYCGLSKTDQTVQVRLGSGENWSNSVKLGSVIDAKPVYVTAGRRDLGGSSLTSATFDPVLTITVR